jgi:hypothetical protein
MEADRLTSKWSVWLWRGREREGVNRVRGGRQSEPGCWDQLVGSGPERACPNRPNACGLANLGSRGGADLDHSEGMQAADREGARALHALHPPWAPDARVRPCCALRRASPPTLTAKSTANPSRELLRGAGLTLASQFRKVGASPA